MNLELYEDDLPCDLNEVPKYLVNILESEWEEDEKYAAIERFTLMLDYAFEAIEWPCELLVEDDPLMEEEVTYFEQAKEDYYDGRS